MEGKFFGLFKAKEDWSFLDNNDASQYLAQDLGKSLTFRTLVAPKEVYPNGVTEWEALDSIVDVKEPYQMLWSLIYRKLRANRGNTMITEYEASRLMDIIRQKNASIQIEGEAFTFDAKEGKIESIEIGPEYTGRREEINIFPRLKAKYERKQVFEAHLQAYIVKNIGKGTNTTLDEILLTRNKIEWIGNEVYCGVGMQRIDLMLKLSKEPGHKTIVPVELKATNANEDAVIQIDRYLDWLRQYYIPNFPNESINIRPLIIGEKYKKINRPQRLGLLSRIRSYSSSNVPIEYVEYSIANDQLEFEKVDLG